MSVGHVARLLEEAGIPTVIIAVRAFRHRLESMIVPRALVTPFPLGRPIGAPGDAFTQRAVILAALDLLAKATQPGTLQDLPVKYRPIRIE